MDERIDKIADDSAYMRGQFAEYIKNQQSIIESLKKGHDTHEQHIRGLRSWQDNADGRMWGIGVGLPVILGFIAKITGFFH